MAGILTARVASSITTTSNFSLTASSADQPTQKSKANPHINSRLKPTSLKSIANTKKSAVKVELEFKNLLALKTISLLLTKEALNNERWRLEFAELEGYSDFIILFGSILTNPKEANDIDILIVSDKKNFKAIDEIKNKIQKSQAKKIHLIDLTRAEFKDELKKQNKSYIDALKKGVILFGQDNFIKFIEGLKL